MFVSVQEASARTKLYAMVSKKTCCCRTRTNRLWRQARMRTDIQQLISKMSELEIVDTFNAIEKYLMLEIPLQEAGEPAADFAATYQRLKGDLQAVFNVLPKDLQQLLLFNPEREALLHGSPELTKPPSRPQVQVGVAPSIAMTVCAYMASNLVASGIEFLLVLPKVGSCNYIIASFFRG